MTSKLRHRAVAFVAAGVAALAALAAGAAAALAAPAGLVNAHGVVLGRAGALRPQFSSTGSAPVVIGVSAAIVAVTVVLIWSLDRRSRRRLEAVPDLPAENAADEWADIGARQSSGQDQERKAA